MQTETTNFIELNSETSTDTDIQKTFAVLALLDSIRGQARNQRLQLLNEHRDLSTLKRVFALTYDWRQDLGINPTGISISDRHPEVSIWGLDDSWSHFLNLISSTQQGLVGFVSRRRKFRTFLDQSHPLVAKWCLRILNRDLQVFISTKMLAKVWGNEVCIPFSVPTITEARTDGIRIYIFITNGMPVTFTDRFRNCAVANDCFGKQIARNCRNGVVEGWMTSSDWALTQSLLSHHISTMSKGGFKSVYYGLRLELLNYYHHDQFESGTFAPTNGELPTIVKSLHPRSSIRLAKPAVIIH
jgi:hypothetical protein